MISPMFSVVAVIPLIRGILTLKGLPCFASQVKFSRMIALETQVYR